MRTSLVVTGLTGAFRSRRGSRARQLNWPAWPGSGVGTRRLGPPHSCRDGLADRDPSEVTTGQTVATSEARADREKGKPRVEDEVEDEIRLLQAPSFLLLSSSAPLFVLQSPNNQMRLGRDELERSPGRPSEATLEAALGRLHGSSPRNLPPCPTASQLEDTLERSEEVYQEEHHANEDDVVDVGVLVDGVTCSLGRLALRAQDHQLIWDAEFAFCEELQAQHDSREAERQRKVKNLRIALRDFELDLAVDRAEKEALAKVLSEAEARRVAEYKAGPEFHEDLEQYDATCYKVGLQVGEDRDWRLATDDYAHEAFAAALRECQHRTGDPRLEGVCFENSKPGGWPLGVTRPDPRSKLPELYLPLSLPPSGLFV
ncbi:hypothetical protein Taro_029951 [Colocasia esculenta]|uniref:Uncharacterized protein n=1 Tax=Colocasia esculenta TaxID=4460 RepID=A0A843VMQ5_COLES|nr:hypothetical protein [Colocasia esculenta]